MKYDPNVRIKLFKLFLLEILAWRQKFRKCCLLVPSDGETEAGLGDQYSGKMSNMSNRPFLAPFQISTDLIYSISLYAVSKTGGNSLHAGTVRGCVPSYICNNI